jgi:membrane protease subunit HflK
VYEEYKKAPDVTRQRIYLETMERLFSGTEKIIMDPGATSGAVPYLPLSELTRPRTNPPNTTTPGGNR